MKTAKRSKRAALKVFAVLSTLATTSLVVFPGLSSGATKPGLSGDFSLMAMVHSVSSPGGDPVQWDGASPGTFRYSAIPCSGNAPVNNISTNLTTYNSRLAGSSSPASTRSHPFEFDVSGASVNGRITLTVCQLKGGPTPADDPVPDAEKSKINITFSAPSFVKTSPEEVSFTANFQLAGGTGEYSDLTGSGKMHAYLFCFQPGGFGAGGACGGGPFTDGQYTMNGTYSDPTARARR